VRPVAENSRLETSGRLSGRVAVVTGAAGGIGPVYARALAQAGAAVVLADLAGDVAAARAAAIAEDGHEALGVQVDVTDEASLASMVSAALERFGRIDILVNNAALMAEIATQDLMALPVDMWKRVLEVNLTGPFLCCRAVVPAMREHGYGKIVNQVSGGAFRPAGVYAASKLGLVSLTVSLAYQLAPSGIRVNAIAPGYVNTEAGLRATSKSPGSREVAERTIPIPFGDPEDLCGALVFLASAASDWVTGQTLGVDGGWIVRV
jgi:NAD(P)-dependent dehydrogenase (short-subunit alcohol dehydrogenase family)